MIGAAYAPREKPVRHRSLTVDLARVERAHIVDGVLEVLVHRVERLVPGGWAARAAGAVAFRTDEKAAVGSGASPITTCITGRVAEAMKVRDEPVRPRLAARRVRRDEEHVALRLRLQRHRERSRRARRAGERGIRRLRGRRRFSDPCVRRRLGDARSRGVAELRRRTRRNRQKQRDDWGCRPHIV